MLIVTGAQQIQILLFGSDEFQENVFKGLGEGREVPGYMASMCTIL